MQAGELRNRITIQKQVSTQDSFGQQVETWTDIATVWSNINPIAGREFFAAETVNSEITHKIRIRFRSDITPDMRVVYQSRMFFIQTVINEYEKNTVLQLMCKELV